MKSHRLHNTVYAALDDVLAAEKITRVKLAELSRDLLVYVVETHDIDIVNRLINGLTPMNKKTSILFFTHFLPWNVEKQDDKFARFGKMLDKPKQIKKRSELIAEFLSDESNDIWTWSEENIEVEVKEISLSEGLEKALVRAIEGVDTDKTHGDPVSKEDIIRTVMKHITLDEMMNALAAFEEEPTPNVGPQAKVQEEVVSAAA